VSPGLLNRRVGPAASEIRLARLAAAAREEWAAGRGPNSRQDRAVLPWRRSRAPTGHHPLPASFWRGGSSGSGRSPSGLRSTCRPSVLDHETMRPAGRRVPGDRSGRTHRPRPRLTPWPWRTANCIHRGPARRSGSPSALFTQGERAGVSADALKQHWFRRETIHLPHPAPTPFPPEYQGRGERCATKCWKDLPLAAFFIIPLSPDAPFGKVCHPGRADCTFCRGSALKTCDIGLSLRYRGFCPARPPFASLFRAPFAKNGQPPWIDDRSCGPPALPRTFRELELACVRGGPTTCLAPGGSRWGAPHAQTRRGRNRLRPPGTLTG